MKSEIEIHNMIDKVMEYHKSLAWWDDGKEETACIIDALLWVIGDRSGKSIDPEEWSKENEN